MWARTDRPGLPTSPFWFYDAETGPWGPVAEVDGERGFGFKWRGFQFGAGHTAGNKPCQIWAVPFLAMPLEMEICVTTTEATRINIPPAFWRYS